MAATNFVMSWKTAAELRIRLAEVQSDVVLAKQLILRLDADAAEAEERHALAQELALAQVDLARQRTRLAHRRSIREVLGDGEGGDGVDRRVYYIGEEQDEFASPLSDAHAVQLLVGVLLQAETMTRTVLVGNACVGMCVQELPSLLARAAGLASDLSFLLQDASSLW